MDLISLMEFTVIITVFVISMFWKAPYSITNTALATVSAAPSCHLKHGVPSQSSPQRGEHAAAGAARAQSGSLACLDPETSILSGRQSNLKFNHPPPERECLIIAFLEKGTGQKSNSKIWEWRVGVCQAMDPWLPCGGGGAFFLGQSLGPFLAAAGRATLGKSAAQEAGGQDAVGHALARAPVQERYPQPVLLCSAFLSEGLFLPCGKAIVSRDGRLARSARQGLRDVL